MAFVRLELDAADLPRLPPFADLLHSRGRLYLPLDARTSRATLGLLRSR